MTISAPACQKLASIYDQAIVKEALHDKPGILFLRIIHESLRSPSEGACLVGVTTEKQIQESLSALKNLIEISRIELQAQKISPDMVEKVTTLTSIFTEFETTFLGKSQTIPQHMKELIELDEKIDTLKELPALSDTLNKKIQRLREVAKKAFSKIPDTQNDAYRIIEVVDKEVSTIQTEKIAELKEILSLSYLIDQQIDQLKTSYTKTTPIKKMFADRWLSQLYEMKENLQKNGLRVQEPAKQLIQATSKEAFEKAVLDEIQREQKVLHGWTSHQVGKQSLLANEIEQAREHRTFCLLFPLVNTDTSKRASSIEEPQQLDIALQHIKSEEELAAAYDKLVFTLENLHKLNELFHVHTATLLASAQKALSLNKCMHIFMHNPKIPAMSIIEKDINILINQEESKRSIHKFVELYKQQKLLEAENNRLKESLNKLFPTQAHAYEECLARLMESQIATYAIEPLFPFLPHITLKLLQTFFLIASEELIKTHPNEIKTKTLELLARKKATLLGPEMAEAWNQWHRRNHLETPPLERFFQLPIKDRREYFHIKSHPDLTF